MTIVSLDVVPEGRIARVLRISGGRNVMMRLLAMGVIPGSTVRVISNKMHGPVVIEVRSTTIGIGRGVARKIIVEVTE
ncbi:MAG: ferrous iron transport protein A [Euryarchaeota archaeon]|nr:ferrous iron transport protein A [Euryarchaeota archaeon]MCD6158280.1 ferrous iron transport protein A [Euryarchaeota archaeon]